MKVIRRCRTIIACVWLSAYSSARGMFRRWSSITLLETLYNLQVAHFWDAPWTLFKALFLFNRYGTLFGQIIITLEEMGYLSHNSQEVYFSVILVDLSANSYARSVMPSNSTSLPFQFFPGNQSAVSNTSQLVDVPCFDGRAQFYSWCVHVQSWDASAVLRYFCRCYIFFMLWA